MPPVLLHQFTFLFILFLVSACGGDSPQVNPHNERYIASEDETTLNQSETSTSNNEVVDKTGAEIVLISESNFVCTPDRDNLSTNPPPKYLMVGNGGKILVSQDGGIWSELLGLPTAETLYAVTKGTNVYVAVGANGTAICSPNGYDWFEFDTNKDKQDKETDDLFGVTSNGNQFVIVGQNGVIFTNTSNTEWSRVDAGRLVTDFYDVAWGKDKFVAVGGRQAADATPVIVTSFNGTNWKIASDNTIHVMRHISWTGTYFVAGGDVLVDDECEQDCEVKYTLYTSKDGVSWASSKTELQEGFTDSTILAVDGDEENMFAIGRAKSSDVDHYFYMKYDPSQDNPWIVSYSIHAQNYVDLIVRDGNTYTLSTADAITTLSKVIDGHFQLPQSIIEPKLNFAINDVFYDALTVMTICPRWDIDTYLGDATPEFYGSQYVAVGADGNIFASQYGFDWVAADVDVELKVKKDDKNIDKRANDGVGLRSVIATPNSFYTVGDKGTIMCSNNGRQWRTLPSGVTANLKSIASNGQLLVAVSDTGSILTSVNGIQWDNMVFSQSGIDKTYAINKIIWANDMFLAVGGDVSKADDGFVLSNVDPLTSDWEYINISSALAMTDTAYLNDVIWVADKFYAVGYKKGACIDCDRSTLVVTSSDGVNWSSETLDHGSQFKGSQLRLVASRGNEVVSIGSVTYQNGDDSAMYTLNRSLNNNQIVNWPVTLLSSADSLKYNNIKHFEGVYWLAGNRGEVSMTDASLIDLKMTILGDFDVYDIAINPPMPSATVGKFYQYKPSIVEKDGQELIYSATPPSWLTIDSYYGTLSGTPTIDDVNTDDPESQIFTLKAKQDTKAVLEAFSDPPLRIIVVENNEPVINDANDENISILLKDSYSFRPIAYDLDGEQLTFGISIKKDNVDWMSYDATGQSVPVLPVGESWLTFDSSTGAVFGTPSLSDIAVYSIVITVSDGTDTVSSKEYTISVSNYPEEFPI